MGILDKAGLSLDSLNPMTNIPENLPADQLTPYAYVPENNAPDPYQVQQDYIKDTLAQVEQQKKDVADQKTKAQEIIDDINATAPWLNAVPEIQAEVDALRDWYAEERAAKGSKFNNYELLKKANDTKLKLDAIKNEHTKVMNQVYTNAAKIVDPNFYDDNAGEIYREEVNKVFAENPGKSISELAPKIAAINLPVKAEALPKWIVSNKIIPGMTSISSLVSETDEQAIKDNAEGAFMSQTDAKKDNIIKVLQQTVNDETGEPYLGADASYTDAAKAVQDFSMNFYRKRISKPSSGRSASGSGKPVVYNANFNYLTEDDANRGLKKGDINTIVLQSSDKKVKVLQLKGWKKDSKSEEVIPVEIIPFMDGGVRKYKIKGIPYKNFAKVSGSSGISGDSQLTFDDVNANIGKAVEYPLSGFDNYDVIKDNYTGFEEKVNAQEERDKKRGIQQEEKGFAAMY